MDRKDCNLGTWLFNVCIHIVLTTPLVELGKVQVVTVNEPGKARTVTKSATALKIVFDVVSKICSRALKRAFPSSYAGMAQADHPWRFF